MNHTKIAAIAFGVLCLVAVVIAAARPTKKDPPVSDSRLPYSIERVMGDGFIRSVRIITVDGKKFLVVYGGNSHIAMCEMK